MTIKDLTDIFDIQYQVQELSGIDNAIIEDPESSGEDYVAVLDSFPSTPAFRVNVPEISNASSRFVYNFFTANEREFINAENQVLDVSVSRDEEIFFQLNNDKKPRYVEIFFTPPKRNSIIKELRNSRIVSQNIDKILIEGGVTNEEFTSFEIIDSQKEKHLYNMLDGSIFLTQTSEPKDSPQDAYAKLLEAQEDGRLTGEEKKLIASALKGLQSKGYRVAKTDISKEEAENADDLTARQNFAIQANKLIFDQLVDSAIRIPDSLFQDEFYAIRDSAIRASRYAIRRNTTNKESEKTYTTNAAVIESIPLASSFGKNNNAKSFSKAYQKYPIIKHAGYIINKLEVMENDTYENRGRLVTDNPDGLYIIDKNVRYGGIYVYEIRSVYYVQMIAEERNEDDPSLDDVSLVSILIASEGKMTGVHCIEHEPPPPPENIRISFDYKVRKPRISWQFPINPQRDIKRFQIFKRSNLRQPFTLIAEFDFDNSTIRSLVAEEASTENLFRFPHPKVNYIDNSWEDGDKPIYAIACVDAHGLSSNYSTQMRFSYNKRLNKVKNEMISFPNAPKPYPNLLINKDSFEDAIKVSGYDRMRVYLDPEYYKVTRYIDESGTREKDLDFLRIDPNKDTYQMHMINIDNHKDKILNIRIADFSGDPSVSTTNV